MIQKMELNKHKIATQRHILALLSNKKKIECGEAKTATTQLTAAQMMLKDRENDMNGLTKTKEYLRYLRLSNICLALIGLKVFLGFIYFEYDHKTTLKTDWLINLAYILHCFIVALRLTIEKMKQQRMHVIQKLSYSYQWQIVKIVIGLAFYPMPWLQQSTFQVNYTDHSGNTTSYPFKTNYLLLIPSIIDSIIEVIHILILNSIYYSPRAQRVGKIYQIPHHGELYAIKCIVKDRPFLGFALISGMVLFLTVFSLRIVEGDIPIDGNHFVHYQNCFWFICITITTVGYGDMYPVSDLGHIMVCFCCIWSCFNTSVVAFMLVSNLSLNQAERKSLQILKNVDDTLSRKSLCKEYIQTTVYRLWLNKKYKTEFRQSLKQKKLRGILCQLRGARKKSMGMIDLGEEMEKEFEVALINVDILTQNTKNLLDHIANKYFVNSKKTNDGSGFKTSSNPLDVVKLC